MALPVRPGRPLRAVRGEQEARIGSLKPTARVGDRERQLLHTLQSQRASDSFNGQFEFGADESPLRDDGSIDGGRFQRERLAFDLAFCNVRGLFNQRQLPRQLLPINSEVEDQWSA